MGHFSLSDSLTSGAEYLAGVWSSWLASSMWNHCVMNLGKGDYYASTLSGTMSKKEPPFHE